MRLASLAVVLSALAPAPPTVALAPVVAERAGPVDVHVAGFPADAEVAVAIDGRAVAAAQTAPNGSLDAKVVMPPALALGNHVVTATAPDGTSAQAAFVVVQPLRGRLVTIAYPSRSLRGTMHASVYLPPGYRTSSLRYPALYFLHGLPADANAYARHAGLIAQLVEALSKPAIVVVPQAARDDDEDPEYSNWGAGRNWEHAISVELPAYIDHRFRTIRARTARAIVGVSAGGYGAALCGLQHLGTFSVIQSWSGYFRPTDPSGAHVVSRGSPQADAAASIFAAVPRLSAAFAARPTSFSFYVGAGDPTFESDNVTLDAQLTSFAVPHTFRLYPGGHSWSLWDVHAEEWLGAALSELSAAR